jgi:hypothetical protein
VPESPASDASISAGRLQRLSCSDIGLLMLLSLGCKAESDFQWRWIVPLVEAYLQHAKAISQPLDLCFPSHRVHTQAQEAV